MKSGREYYRYSFEKEKCKNCPLRRECIKEKRVRKILVVGLNTPEFYGYSQEQKTEEFKEKYKKRACQEWKNGEMKNFHGLDRAKGYGLISMTIQAKLTAIAVNLKRIANILSSLHLFFLNFLATISRIMHNPVNLFHLLGGVFQQSRTSSTSEKVHFGKIRRQLPTICR